MKVAVWHNNRDIRIESIPVPAPGPGELLVKVMACGICGSDVVEWYRLPRAPLVLGHEVGGEVVEIGDRIGDIHPGDRVALSPKAPCMHCRYCANGHYPVCTCLPERLPGGFAEYIRVPESLARNGTWLLPDTVSYDQATFIEPLACVVRAHRLADVRKGGTVLVLGCGNSGLLHIRLAKATGCDVSAVDINPFRLEMARQSGADRVLRPEEMEQASIRTDFVFVCASAMSAVDAAWKSVDKGGAVVFFAVPGPEKTVRIPINEFWMKEIRILTAYYCGPPDIAESIRLIQTGRIPVDDMITHRLPLQDIASGFDLVIRADRSMKVIIRPHGDRPR